MASVFKPFYILLEELRKIEKLGDGDLRIIPMTIEAPQKTKTLLAWPFKNYVELQTSWKLIQTTIDGVPEWPLGDGILVNQEISKIAPNPEASKTTEPNEETLKLVEKLPTVKEARRALQTALKKIDPYYEVRSRLRYLPWVIGIGALGILLAIVFKASKSPALKGYLAHRKQTKLLGR